MGRNPEGKAEKMFKKIGKNIDKLLSQLDEAKGDAKVEYSDRIEELKRNGESLKEEINKFKTNHKEVFNDIEEGFEKVGKEIKEVVDKTFKKKKKE
ncbi:MAG: hypothetical protein OEX22_03210 [Cyclobacteriaceae bacterium]|nr:hypothetical protein [Cyclobacteriaceae bacterium]